MTERSYTISELDALRQAVDTKWLFGTYYPPLSGGSSRSYFEHERTKAVEELVRTHMLAGHTANDLYDSEQLIT